MITVDHITKSHLVTDVFMDGDDPKHQQLGHCREYPALTFAWTQRKGERGVTKYFVNDKEFAPGDWQAICDELNAALGEHLQTHDDDICTDCDDTGITYQTERRCACQGPVAKVQS